MAMPPKLWQGPSAVGEAADRANKAILPDLPYCTHSGPGFRAEKKGEFSEVFLDAEKGTTTEDSWISMSSAFDDGYIHVVGSDDPRKSFKRRFTTTSGISGWGAAPIQVYPNGKGKGYFFTTEPFSPPFGELNVQLLGRFGRSAVHQYHIHAWAFSIEYTVGFSTPVFLHAMLHINGAECHIRSENWGYMDGAVQRNSPLLKASIKSDSGWGEYTLAAPELPAHSDCGLARLCVLSPTKMVILVCDHPDNYPSIFHGHPLGGPWTKAPLDLEAAFPGDVPEQAAYWETEALWAAAHTDVTDPQQIRYRFLSQATVARRVRTRGTQCAAHAVDSDHILYETGWYPMSELSATIGFSLSLVNVNTGEVTNILHRSRARPTTYSISTEAKVIGRDAWVLEISTSSFTQLPTIEEALITYDRGVTYTPVVFPDGYRPGSIEMLKPVAEIAGPCVAVVQVAEEGNLRMYETKDFVTFKRRGLLAKAALIDNEADFWSVTKLGTRADPGYIDSVSPWTSDTRQSVPEWW